MERIRLLLVDDHTMFRDGLRAVLENEEDMVTVGEAGDAATAVRLAAELQPDVVVMDLHLARSSGVDATREILAQMPDAHIVALTMYQDDDLIASTIRAGARGYVLKDARAADLVQAVRTVAAGGAAIDPSVATRVLDQYRHLASDDSRGSGELSDRELRVLRLLGAGDSNREIAEKLGRSEQTIKNILSTIYQRLGVENRTEAVVVALHRGLISRGD